LALQSLRPPNRQRAQGFHRRSWGLAAAALQTLARLPGGRGLSLNHKVPYIAAGAGAAFFVRRVFRLVCFFAALRRVFLAAPLAPALRTVRFLVFVFVFVFAFRLDFFAVIGM